MVDINRSEEYRQRNGVVYDLEIILEPISHPQLSELAIVKHAALQRMVHHVDEGLTPVAGDIDISRLEQGCRVVEANEGVVRHIQGVLYDYARTTFEVDRLPENQRFVETRRKMAGEIAHDIGVALEVFRQFDELHIVMPDYEPQYSGQDV